MHPVYSSVKKQNKLLAKTKGGWLTSDSKNWDKKIKGSREYYWEHSLLGSTYLIVSSYNYTFKWQNQILGNL